MNLRLRHGSLFSGIGGFDQAAEWMRWENVFHCEWNEFGQKVLKHYWPKAETFTDITKSNFTKYHGTIDIISGGFPCQPYSAAGKRLGKEDERHLWPEMLRAIREISPRWVVGENVRGLISWNGGLVFDEVQSDLEAAGYEVLPFLLPACAVNAPHRRERIWFIAHANSGGVEQRQGERGIQPETIGQPEEANSFSELGKSGFATDTKSNGDRGELRRLESEDGSKRQSEEYRKDDLQPGDDGQERDAPDAEGIGVEGMRSGREQEQRGLEQEGVLVRSNSGTDWSDWPTQPPLRSRDDGFSPEIPGTTVSKHRVESIKAYGNAVVPQVVFEIFKAIEAYERIIQAGSRI